MSKDTILSTYCVNRENEVWLEMHDGDHGLNRPIIIAIGKDEDQAIDRGIRKLTKIIKLLGK